MPRSMLISRRRQTVAGNEQPDSPPPTSSVPMVSNNDNLDDGSRDFSEDEDGVELRMDCGSEEGGQPMATIEPAELGDQQVDPLTNAIFYFVTLLNQQQQQQQQQQQHLQLQQGHHIDSAIEMDQFTPPPRAQATRAPRSSSSVRRSGGNQKSNHSGNLLKSHQHERSLAESSSVDSEQKQYNQFISDSQMSSQSQGKRSSSGGSDDNFVHYCDDCGKRYSTSSNLARHRQTHRDVTDKKARKCPECDKIYVSMPAFSMHLRTHNQGCICSICSKSFSRPWLLQGHMRTHTGEKPFRCKICDKAFADKSNLRAHIQTHSTTKPFVCDRCNKAFALKSYLCKHVDSTCMRANGSQKEPLNLKVLNQPKRSRSGH